MDNINDWDQLKKSVQDIHEAIVGSTNKVGLIEWQRTQDVKITDLAARLTRLELAKESVVGQVLNKLWVAVWAALMGLMASKIGR